MYNEISRNFVKSKSLSLLFRISRNKKIPFRDHPTFNSLTTKTDGSNGAFSESCVLYEYIHCFIKRFHNNFFKANFFVERFPFRVHGQNKKSHLYPCPVRLEHFYREKTSILNYPQHFTQVTKELSF
jgi:predicted AAA+ superfamily ATPase